jgi:hypothetical protein
MKYNLDQTLKTLEGADLATSEKDQTPFSVRNAIANALLLDTDDNKPSKMDRYALFVRIKTLKESDFTTKEAALMREAVLSAYNTFVAGQTVDALDGTVRVPAGTEG